MNLRESIVRNTLFGIIANVTQLTTRLVTIPIVISHLGLDGYGVWSVLVTAANYMRFGSVGVKTAFQKYVAEATGDGDYTKASKLLSTGCAIMLIVSVVTLVPAAIWSYPLAKVLGVPAEFLGSGARAVSLFAFIMAFANVGAAFEAIVMGGHRIDLVRTYGAILAVAEAMSIVLALSLGHGLAAMAAIMGASELMYVCLCYIASRNVVPEVSIGLRYVSKDVIPELFRFAGSYQLVNILEVVTTSVVPIAILKSFGATVSGVYAVVSRVLTSAMMLQEAFLPTILSGGTMVHASGSVSKMHSLVARAFRVTFSLSILPLGFVAMFGPTIVQAWTGQSHPALSITFYLVGVTALCKAVSLLALVLYRVTGKALLDNVRQVFRLIIIITVAAFAGKLGFYGFLGTLAAAEVISMFFMLFVLTWTFEAFKISSLVPDALRVAFASALILGVGVLTLHLPGFVATGERTASVIKLAQTSIACFLVMYPFALWTGFVKAGEGSALLEAILNRHRHRE